MRMGGMGDEYAKSLLKLMWERFGGFFRESSGKFWMIMVRM
jgi:hypothetical protein